MFFMDGLTFTSLTFICAMAAPFIKETVIEYLWLSTVIRTGNSQKKPYSRLDFVSTCKTSVFILYEVDFI